MRPALSSQLLEQFIAIVGEKNALTRDDDITHFTHENRNYVIGETPLVLKPENTGQVSALLKLATKTKTAIVPQGGHTGHMGGGVPLAGLNSIVIATQRMNKMREIDLAANIICVEAGMVLENIQNLAEHNNRLFPLSLGAQGSCMIGGNISTNAGGTGVLAYGNTRDLVIGLEVVLPNGDIWNGLNKLRKNNTGYDLKNLFIGAEGTLGIVTAAVLKLFAMPLGREVLWTGFSSPENALDFFQSAKAKAGNQLTAFELVPRIGIEFLLKNYDRFSDPLDKPYPWYGLVEISSGRSARDARQLSEEIFKDGLDKNSIEDAIMAVNLAQQKLFWQMREDLPGSQYVEDISISHDISVPIGEIPQLLKQGEKLVSKIIPGIRMIAFGHMGDGNIHFNFSNPIDMDHREYVARRGEVNDIVYKLVLEMGGSISAEHGIGLFKRDELAQIKSPVEMAMMHQIKRTFDPLGIMNPGKVLKL